MITTVVFDLDDTLYEEIEYCRSGFFAVADFLSRLPAAVQKYESDDIFKILWEQFFTGDSKKVFNAALDKMEIDYNEDTILNLVGIYRNHEPNILLPDISKSVLDQFSGKYSLSLLTDGFLPAQELKVRALGIERYFDCIVYTEALGREFWKPSPEGFKLILKKLRQKGHNCVYVADNAEKDFIGPNSLGFTTVQLIRPLNIHKGAPEQPNAAPGHIINSLSQLPSLIKRL